jgi:endonuclease I
MRNWQHNYGGLIAGIFIILSLALPVAGQIPPGYYDPAAGKTGTALQAALHGIIDNHTQVAYSALYFHFQSTDKKSDNTVWDMYSDIPGGTPPYVYQYSSGDECGNYNGEGDCYNREHSWPNSWFGGEVYPMYSDLFHLYPTDGYVNNRRSNYPFGEVGSATWTSLNGSKVGNCIAAGYTGTVFEPIDEYKGDFARTYFYMSVRYYTEDSSWPGSPQANGAQLTPWALDMMQQWHTQDPVSSKETSRNNAVYQVQHNRNPFIDHPEFAGEIWGWPVGIPAEQTAVKTLLIYPNPADDVCKLDIPEGISRDAWRFHAATLTGKRITLGYTQSGNTLNIDVTSLPGGVYILTLSDETGSWHGKMARSNQ